MHYIETLIIAFPMKVAPKNILKGIKNYPHINPAKSKSGFGIYKNMFLLLIRFIFTEAQRRTTINACYLRVL